MLFAHFQHCKLSIGTSIRNGSIKWFSSQYTHPNQDSNYKNAVLELNSIMDDNQIVPNDIFLNYLTLIKISFYSRDLIKTKFYREKGCQI